MQPGSDRRTWRRYIAVGDSFTEGLSDPDPGRAGEYRGWADRLAGHLAAAAPSGAVEYANLAVRGRLLLQVLAEQVPVALGVPVAGDDTDWRAPPEPAPAADPRGGRQELAWVFGFVLPWIGRSPPRR